MSDKSDTIKRVGTDQQKLKEMFISELIGGKCLGNVMVAAKRIGVSRQTLYRWREEDSNFASIWSKAKIEVDEVLIEKAESALVGAIESGNITAIIFTLKTRAPDRWGENRNNKYSERIEDQYSVSPEFSEAMHRYIQRHNK